eukprot:CAMPEP_0181248984 /NCGR_PEP_ID=MMETSP1096-20121128/45487_1 /TAXON_ID=156174 ORGANISM="Chrysochromulina ericina, Strain CCMP281" /NCGR_SAMPLE_ID=MMETSP1096 /ASSEMBLY_ACC=CAM_ASM_000453 /LENGTH=117 /DNA_ID=CAMNT_0023346241 /DNA_START=80 /DNA_END=434 /DNA_ORIENTATION=+
MYANAVAAFCVPAIGLLPVDAPQAASTSWIAAARNMMFATAIMLSKESAPGGPGVAIGINQSACSLGAALGPMLCGLGYTQSLLILRTSTPFFTALGVVGLLPGVITQLNTPRWPWH